jgi:hypothetical protein
VLLSGEAATMKIFFDCFYRKPPQFVQAESINGAELDRKIIIEVIDSQPRELDQNVLAIEESIPIEIPEKVGTIDLDGS